MSTLLELADRRCISDDAIKVNRALGAVQRALAIAVFHLKFTRMRDNGTVLQPENRTRLVRLTGMVEEMLEQHRRSLN